MSMQSWTQSIAKQIYKYRHQEAPIIASMSCAAASKDGALPSSDGKVHHVESHVQCHIETMNIACHGVYRTALIPCVVGLTKQHIHNCLNFKFNAFHMSSCFQKRIIWGDFMATSFQTLAKLPNFQTLPSLH